jgi:phosphoglycolate phosphatase-like HAD superfamily hydrolase
MKNGIDYASKIFVGDGENDYCAALGLGENDTLFVRKGYSLEAKLLSNTTL